MVVTDEPTPVRRASVVSDVAILHRPLLRILLRHWPALATTIVDTFHVVLAQHGRVVTFGVVADNLAETAKRVLGSIGPDKKLYSLRGSRWCAVAFVSPG